MVRLYAMVAVLGVAAFGLFGPPALAQLPTLPPLLSTTTTAPGATTTTSTTILPNLLPEEVLTPAPTTPEGAPPSSILPLPTPPPTRKTVAYKPPPVPPSTPAKALPAASKTPRTTAPPQSTDDTEAVEDDSGFDAELPFNQQDAEFLTAEDTMELGIEEAERDQVRPMASVAAALLVFVLLGMALWIRAEVHRVPVYTGRGRHFKAGKRQITEDGEFYWDS